MDMTTEHAFVSVSPSQREAIAAALSGETLSFEAHQHLQSLYDHVVDSLVQRHRVTRSTRLLQSCAQQDRHSPAAPTAAGAL